MHGLMKIGCTVIEKNLFADGTAGFSRVSSISLSSDASVFRDGCGVGKAAAAVMRGIKMGSGARTLCKSCLK